MVILGLAVVAQPLAADQALDEPLGGDQGQLLGRHALHHQQGAGLVRHHHIKLTRRDV